MPPDDDDDDDDDDDEHPRWWRSAILNIGMTLFFCRGRTGRSGLDEIWQTGAEYHADCGDVVEIETGIRIPIWRTFVFSKPEIITSQPWIEL